MGFKMDENLPPDAAEFCGKKRTKSEKREAFCHTAAANCYRGRKWKMVSTSLLWGLKTKTIICCAAKDLLRRAAFRRSKPFFGQRNHLQRAFGHTPCVLTKCSTAMVQSLVPSRLMSHN
jgi:hypothetical protein